MYYNIIYLICVLYYNILYCNCLNEIILNIYMYVSNFFVCFFKSCVWVWIFCYYMWFEK